MPPLDATYTAPSELLSHQYGSESKELDGNPMSVLVASGPYTVDSDLEYEPLQALLEMAARERPDVVVLVRFRRFLFFLLPSFSRRNANGGDVCVNDTDWSLHRRLSPSHPTW
jgi:hypothetical protein